MDGQSNTENSNNTNDNSSSDEQNKKYNVKLMIRIIEALVFILFFVPSFTVSCSNQNVNVSGVDIMAGMKTEDGVYVVDPHPIMFVVMLLPIVLIVMSFIIKQNHKRDLYIVTLVCAVVDLFVWLYIRSAVSQAASDYMCSSRTNAGYYLTVISLIVLIIISALIVFRRIEDDQPLQKVGDMQKQVKVVLDNVNVTLNKEKNKETIKCISCGAEVAPDAQFCGKCGAKIEHPTVIHCKTCGSVLAPDAKFCGKCGAKVDDK